MRLPKEIGVEGILRKESCKRLGAYRATDSGQGRLEADVAVSRARLWGGERQDVYIIVLVHHYQLVDSNAELWREPE